jgi:hypothetical protein
VRMRRRAVTGRTASRDEEQGADEEIAHIHKDLSDEKGRARIARARPTSLKRRPRSAYISHSTSDR